MDKYKKNISNTALLHIFFLYVSYIGFLLFSNIFFIFSLFPGSLSVACKPMSKLEMGGSALREASVISNVRRRGARARGSVGFLQYSQSPQTSHSVGLMIKNGLKNL